MPRIVKMYNTSRKGLAHNMGSLFGLKAPKKKKTSDEKAEDVGKKVLPKTIDVITKRKKALADIPYD